jgi:hypothetical protein
VKLKTIESALATDTSTLIPRREYSRLELVEFRKLAKQRLEELRKKYEAQQDSMRARASSKEKYA